MSDLFLKINMRISFKYSSTKNIIASLMYLLLQSKWIKVTFPYVKKLYVRQVGIYFNHHKALSCNWGKIDATECLRKARKVAVPWLGKKGWWRSTIYLIVQVGGNSIKGHNFWNLELKILISDLSCVFHILEAMIHVLEAVVNEI